MVIAMTPIRYPNMLKRLTILILLTSIYHGANAQDTLPHFSVKNRAGKVIIGWVNPFTDIVQMSIQRSPDSLKGYKTILSVADPSAITNGYLDNKAPNATQFYRIYVQQTGGKYFYTPIRRPTTENPVVMASKPKDNASTTPLSPASAQAPKVQPKKPEPKPEPIEMITVEETGISYAVARNNNPRIIFSGNGVPPVSVKMKAPALKDIFVPSVFVHTNAYGHVVIALPEDKTKSYSIKFFKDDGTPLFTMHKIKESQLILDKTNFMQAGWFRFELYENDQLKEKHKFQIPKDN